MLSAKPAQGLPNELLRIIAATHHDPFEVLGKHPLPVPTQTADTLIRVFIPGARAVALHLNGVPKPIERIEGSDFF
jgi:1,4-alpha-glucan branching enzyme